MLQPPQMAWSVVSTVIYVRSSAPSQLIIWHWRTTQEQEGSLTKKGQNSYAGVLPWQQPSSALSVAYVQGKLQQLNNFVSSNCVSDSHKAASYAIRLLEHYNFPKVSYGNLRQPQNKQMRTRTQLELAKNIWFHDISGLFYCSVSKELLWAMFCV